MKQPSLEKREEAQLQEKRGCGLTQDSCLDPWGQRSQRYPRARVWRLPDCTHLVLTSMALLRLCHQTHRPVLGDSDTSQDVASPNSPCLPPAPREVAPSSLRIPAERWLDSLNHHPSLRSLPEASIMWECNGDDGQQLFSALMPCSPGQPCPPSAPSPSPPPPPTQGLNEQQGQQTLGTPSF